MYVNSSPFFQNRMDDSVELFKSIYANEHLRLASLIIFANKRDLFKRKIKYSALRNYYAEYQGDLAIFQNIYKREKIKNVLWNTDVGNLLF